MATINRTGEPYKLSGNRMAFTSWLYVRPGLFGWFDSQGNNVSVKGNFGPHDAHIRHFEKADGICLFTGKPKRTSEIFGQESAFEKDGIAMVTIFKENGIFRGWGCTGWGDLEGKGIPVLCYLESDDGYNWKRPNCGIVEFEGCKNNNILRIFSGYASWGTVFIDPSALPCERYKWISEHHYSKSDYQDYCKQYPTESDYKSNRIDVGCCIAVKGAVSSDGISWKEIEKPIGMFHSDTHIVVYYDVHLKKYVGYFRDWISGNQAETFSNNDSKEYSMSWLRSARRAVGRAETDNFYHWSLPNVVLEPNLSMSPNDVLYTNCKTTIPDAPDNHLMFPAVWDTYTDKTYIALATSNDGSCWNYASNNIIETAPYGQWDGGCIFAIPNLIELPNGDFALPYTGFNVPHKYPRQQAIRGGGYAVWEKGRLMGIRAVNDGCFTTTAVVAPSEKLMINAEIDKEGFVEIEAADFNGNTIPGREFENSVRLTGDCFKKQVTWKSCNDLGIKKGQPIMLRFRMSSAIIYFIDFY